VPRDQRRLAQEWLDRDPRLRGSLNVPFDSPDLAVAEIERFADPGNGYRGSGAPSYYLEQHVWLHLPVERLAMSLICEGVFDEYPRLQVALVEACLTWSGPLQWAMDAAYEVAGNDAPRLSKLYASRLGRG
jgi:predicted TIM-barrel fold metal-dependent hydrolase